MRRYGSDVVVALLAEAGIEYVSLNPGASVRGIQDSLVNGDPDAPLTVTCLHEEIAVAAAHGYAKAAGKPMAVLLHNIVGLQHASMAVFNAWCDRVPIMLIGGTGPMSKRERRPWIEWIHTALVQGEQIRDYVKWDDQPWDLASLPESFARGWHTACAEPPGPVYICVDAGIQEQEIDDFVFDGPNAYRTPSPPGLAREDVQWLAGRLTSARLPVLLSDYAGSTERGFDALIELAEILQAPVVDCGARLNFPSTHPLAIHGCEQEVMRDADLIVALDVEDTVGRIGPHVLDEKGRRTGRDVSVVSVTPAHLKLRSWSQDYQQLLQVDRHLTATCDSALPDLVEAVRRSPPPAALLDERRRRVGHRNEEARRAWRREAEAAQSEGSIPVSRLAFELGELIADRHWTVVAGRFADWERRLWRFERFGQRLGWHGGAGLGYQAGASIGAALALGGDTLSVCLLQDGDLLYTPSALWTAAHLSLPILYVMHNNRQYGNTVGHSAQIARARGRSEQTRHVGSGLTEPSIDFAGLARSMGVDGTGPVSRLEELGPAIMAALKVVDSGRPALVDVVTTGA